MKRQNKAVRKAERKAKQRVKTNQKLEAQAKDTPLEIEWRTAGQKLAWQTLSNTPITFLLGAAGSGKTFLAMAYAINEILNKRRTSIILTRPIVEAGERLGYLPGSFGEKVNPYMTPLYDTMDLLLGKFSPRRELVNKSIVLAPLCYMRGRSQPLDAKVLTPAGYRNMGDIKVGDSVLGSDGLPTKVLGVYPQGELDVYKIEFSDGTSVECSGDHLWQTATLNEQRTKQKHSVKTTLQIKETLRNKHGQKTHRLPMAEPAHFSNSGALPIAPYVLGALLGDGNLHKTTNITLTNTDQELVARVTNILAPTLELVGAESRKQFAPQYRIVGRRRGHNPLRGVLTQLGLRGKTAKEKFIPQQYLHAAIQDRIELLRGLMDTDGSVFAHRSGNSRVQYYSTSQRLAEDVRFLVHSLGGTASVRTRNYSSKNAHTFRGRVVAHRSAAYVVDIVLRDINPFHVARKANRWKPGKPQRLICGVEFVGKKPCQCIRVDAQDHLYLTEHCIVTHNTFNDAICIFDEAQNASYQQLKLFLSRFGQNTQVVVTGDPQQSDLPYSPAPLVEVVNKLRDVKGIETIQFSNDDVVRHPIVAAVLKKL